MIFQLFVKGEKVGGGGRYDGLIPAMGGAEVPASGFALYLDALMKLVGTAAPEGAAAPVVLVRVPSDDAAVTAGAFKLAGSLREAGYTVAFDLDGEKGGNWRWIVEARTGTAPFVLRDVMKKKEFPAASAGELLKLLEGQGGDKDSPA
jgi:histidyl-tRNA synthetase